MLLDISLLNLFVENFGTTYNTLTWLTSLISQNTINLLLISDLMDVLVYWQSADEMLANKNEILYLGYLAKNYFKALGWVNELSPYFYSFDYLHLFYLKQYFYSLVVWNVYNHAIVFTNVFSYKLCVTFLFTFLFTKWAYAVTLFFICYFFTNINQVRNQYGFNFYFNYFKVISDLGEQEYGSYDDFKFFLFFFVQILLWYCWVLFLGYTFAVESNSFLNILTLTIMLTILLIPVRLLWDFGLSFSVYIRGSANSSNLFVESIFDLLGVIIIFTRFIVQNIRFLLVFVAFFELFEWSAMSFNSSYIFDLSTNQFTLTEILSEPTSLFSLTVNSIKMVSVYIYHLLHLIIISFMQIGVYLMVSFWLFFFLYTSFFKVVIDSYFLSIRVK